MQIGPYKLDTPLILAPMAGVTDRPFRQLCLRMGAGMAVSEMMLANPETWDTEKSKKRRYHADEAGFRSVQILGCDPELMAQAARLNVAADAQIIDINMGCPAKKVNKKLAGSALLQDPALVRDILQAVVAAVAVPVTLKIRTGWDPEHRNGVEIAQLAEQAGIQALTVHGRTRACLFRGEAEYDTIKAIKQAVSIPVIANGDIDSVHKARQVLAYTGADAIMIGRAAQGQPWIFRQIRQYLEQNQAPTAPSLEEVRALVLEHISALHHFYGEYQGVRYARKHVAWYLEKLLESQDFRRGFNALETASAQLDALKYFLTRNSITKSRQHMFEQNLTSDALVTTTTHAHTHEPTQRPLRESVQQALRNYLAQLNGQEVTELYEMVLSEVEAPMLDIIMQYTRGNQTRASIMMGINRGTLRKKLKKYGMN